jgi:nucleoside-triphosphatase
MAGIAPHVLLITGSPGSGKTTLIRGVASSLGNRRLGGFYTEEIRVRGQRRGFRLVTFGGREALMASVDLPGPRRIGRYGVDVAVIDALAESALTCSDEIDLYLVDEIGKMECLSARFVAATRTLLDSGRPVVGAIARHGSGFIAEVKQRTDVELWELTRANRGTLADQVRTWISTRLEDRSARLTTGRLLRAPRRGASPSSWRPGFR